MPSDKAAESRNQGRSLNNIRENEQHNAGIKKPDTPWTAQHNKILCLGIGFALASVLIAKLWYEHEYDTCYPDHDRIYRISEKIRRGSDPEATYGNTPGGIATTLKNISPKLKRQQG